MHSNVFFALVRQHGFLLGAEFVPLLCNGIQVNKLDSRNTVRQRLSWWDTGITLQPKNNVWIQLGFLFYYIKSESLYHAYQLLFICKNMMEIWISASADFNTYTNRIKTCKPMINFQWNIIPSSFGLQNKETINIKKLLPFNRIPV